MEVNMEKDRKTGDTRILSACAVSPEEAQQRGVKVFDDGCKVVYEVRSGQSVATENGVYSWNSSDVDKIMQLVNQSGQSPGGKAVPRATATPPDWAGAGDGRVEVQEQAVHKEAKLEMVAGRHGDGAESLVREVNEVPEASAEKPVTMIFMGYHNVEDEEETKKLLGFNGTIKAEIVLIDEDDEKSLREKTVTDLSTIDGNAADLVSGQPLSDTTELSSEGKEESLDKELPPAGIEKRKRCHCCTVM